MLVKCYLNNIISNISIYIFNYCKEQFFNQNKKIKKNFKISSNNLDQDISRILVFLSVSLTSDKNMHFNYRSILRSSNPYHNRLTENHGRSRICTSREIPSSQRVIESSRVPHRDTEACL